MAGSARKPMARFVSVIPTWAPESWVDSERSAVETPAALRSPDCPLDLGPVDRDQGEFSRHEEPAGDHQGQRDTEQEPVHVAHCCGLTAHARHREA
jgi:hypothetical protein